MSIEILTLFVCSVLAAYTCHNFKPPKLQPSDFPSSIYTKMCSTSHAQQMTITFVVLRIFFFLFVFILCTFISSLQHSFRLTFSAISHTTPHTALLFIHKNRTKEIRESVCNQFVGVLFFSSSLYHALWLLFSLKESTCALLIFAE